MCVIKLSILCLFLMLCVVLWYVTRYQTLTSDDLYYLPPFSIVSQATEL